MFRKINLFVIILVGFYTHQIIAGDTTNTTTSLFNTQHQAGIRLGVWSNRGESPPFTDSVGSFETNIKEENFYFEGYYAHRLMPMLALEGSLGIVNRGSVTFREEGADNVGNILVYSILVQLKCYPLASLNTRLQPFVTAGGGVYYGRRSVQFTTNVYYTGFGEESGTDFSYSIGGGLDYPLGSSIGIEIGVKFMAIDFTDRLLTIQDYDALAFSVGVKYLYSSITGNR